ncbi:MAG TPA: hypothetical protein DD611_00195 [Alphaproteobacteria bacterium]|nr:hypothetical protein [Alphaproteobacteria bacterium]HBS76728.1 hypothetical protein [Alphaproteobacteria bacterium]
MKIKALAFGAMALALAACGDGGQNPAALRGESFIANGDGTDITLSFDENEMRFYGQVVNLYNGSYRAAGNHIQFDQGASTMMMGPANAMATEREYFQFLNTVEKYNLNNDTLTLIGNGKTMTFKRVDANATPDNTVTVTETEAVVVDTPVVVE